MSRPRPVAVKWSPIGKSVIEKQEERQQHTLKRRCYRKNEYEELPAYKKMHSSGRMRLESFERAVRYYFAHSTFKLGYMQKRLIDVFIVSILKKFFANDLVANLSWLGKKFHIDELSEAVAILFPRRSGKTEGSAWFIAVCTVSQPSWNSIMYNLTNRQAKEFLQTVIKHLQVFQNDTEFGWTVERQDSRQYYVIRNNKYNTENSVKSYPCASKASDANIGLLISFYFFYYSVLSLFFSILLSFLFKWYHTACLLTLLPLTHFPNLP